MPTCKEITVASTSVQHDTKTLGPTFCTELWPTTTWAQIWILNPIQP